MKKNPTTKRSQASRANAHKGKRFEAFLQQHFRVIEMVGKGRIEKTDPPTVSGGGKMIRMANPWLDYAGTINGSAVMIEAKITDKPRLSVGLKKGGVTDKQIANMRRWMDAGADVSLVWGLLLPGAAKIEVCMIPAKAVIKAEKSMTFPEHRHPYRLLWELFISPRLPAS